MKASFVLLCICAMFGCIFAEPAMTRTEAAYGSSSTLTSNSTSLTTCRSRTDVVDIAMLHTNGQPYCECVCPSNAPWRCDCSGLVSRAWGVAAPGLTTYYMQGNACSKLGSRDELLPGDVLLWPGVISKGTGHVAMFIKWVDKSAGSFLEAACHSPSMGCTHEVQKLNFYGTEYFPCRPHSGLVC